MSISDLYAEILEMPLPEALRHKLKHVEGITFAEALALGVLEKAIGGSLPAVREVREATEGKANVRPNTHQREVPKFHVVYDDPPNNFAATKHAKFQNELKNVDEDQTTPNTNESKGEDSASSD